MSDPLTAGKDTEKHTDAGHARETPRAGQPVLCAQDVLVGRTAPPRRSLRLSSEASPEASTGHLCHGNAGLGEPSTHPRGKKEMGFEGELGSNVGTDSLRDVFGHHEGRIKALRETHLLRNILNISVFPFDYIFIIFKKYPSAVPAAGTHACCFCGTSVPRVTLTCT